MENLRVRRAGFAYRREYSLFLQRYKSLAKETWPNYHGNPKDGVQILATTLGYEAEEYKMGKTKIFIRYPKTLFRTEDAFQAKKHYLASKIQACYKGLLQRRRYIKMKKSAIIIQKNVRRHLAKLEAKRRRHAANVIRRFIKGFITRNGPETPENRSFLEQAKYQWLIRLSKSLPHNILKRDWPPSPHVCIEASRHLEKMYGAHLSRVYRLKLTPERREQFKLKVLAEKLFKDQKKSYPGSISHWFKEDRVTEAGITKQSYSAHLNGEKEIVSSNWLFFFCSC